MPLSEAEAAQPSKWASRARNRPRMPLPPSSSQTRSTRRQIQTEEGIRMYIFCLPWQENC